MIRWLLVLAIVLQVVAVAYGIVLSTHRRGATNAWLLLVGGMLSMLAWRVFVMTGAQPSASFNAAIAVWGSTCMLGAMVLFAREVARRERAESERDELLESERVARTEAERAGRLKDDFLATLSHELRTPLSAILGWCSILKLGRLNPTDVPRAVQTIERNANVQVRLVDDLLDATRIQAGTLHLELEPVRLDGPVRAALDAIRPSADAKTLTVQCQVRGEAPTVLGDAGRLQQMVLNLLTNAVKFTPAGGRIDLSIESDATRATLIVSDSGEGIDSAFLPQLFARFRQADSSVARRHGGLGLGLSITLSLARLHGGDVKAESPGLGHGATFTVTLPLAPASALATSVASVESSHDDSASRALEGVRIVVVDDEPDVRAVVSQLVTQLGGEVTALDSGAGIEAVLDQLQPHLLLIDISMPDEDGYSLVRRIRQLPSSLARDVPAVSLTAHARSEDRARALSSGFQEHLPKPIDVPLLVATVRRFVFGAGQPAGAPAPRVAEASNSSGATG